MAEDKKKWTKMSKSKGNGIGVEEIVRGVMSLASDFEFRDLNNQPVDHNLIGIWFDEGSGYRMMAKFGRHPVFLCRIVTPVPAVLTNMTTLQHPTEHNYWRQLIGAM